MAEGGTFMVIKFEKSVVDLEHSFVDELGEIEGQIKKVILDMNSVRDWYHEEREKIQQNYGTISGQENLRISQVVLRVNSLCLTTMKKYKIFSPIKYARLFFCISNGRTFGYKLKYLQNGLYTHKGILNTKSNFIVKEEINNLRIFIDKVNKLNVAIEILRTKYLQVMEDIVVIRNL